MTEGAASRGRFDERDLATLVEHIRQAVANGSTVGRYRFEARDSARQAVTELDSDVADYLRDFSELMARACDEVERPLREAEARSFPSDRVNFSALKARVDLATFIERRGVRLVKYGRRYKGLCPFHEDHDPSFSVDTELQRWHCFGACNRGGDVYDFVMLADRVSFPEAVQSVMREASCPA